MPPDADATPLSKSGVPVCATHPDRTAYSICGRCGDNVCAECSAGKRADNVICHACAARLGGVDATVPWEVSAMSFLDQVTRTLKAVVVAPRDLLGRLPSGPIGRPFQLTFVVYFFVDMGVGLLLLQTAYDGVVLGAVTCLAAYLGGWAAHGVARLAGGADTLSGCLRASAYAWSASIFGAPIGALLNLWVAGFPTTGVKWGLWAGVLLGVPIVARAAFCHARGRQQLGHVASLVYALAMSTAGLAVSMLVGWLAVAAIIAARGP